MNEVVRVTSWIPQQLLADTATTTVIGESVFHGVAERDVAGVHVVYKFVDGRGTYPLGARRILAGTLFDITAWGQQKDLAAVKAVADRIDEIFGFAVNVQWQGWNFSGRLENHLMSSEKDDANKRTWHKLGGTYRISTYEIGS